MVSQIIVQLPDQGTVLSSPPRPSPPKSLVAAARGVLSLRMLQMACCAAVAWAGIYTTANTTRPGDIAEFAARNFRTANPAQAGVNAALEVAEASLSSISVVVQRNETLDQIFRRLELSLTDLANLRAISGARAALDKLRPGDLLTLVHRGGELVVAGGKHRSPQTRRGATPTQGCCGQTRHRPAYATRGDDALLDFDAACDRSRTRWSARTAWCGPHRGCDHGPRSTSVVKIGGETVIPTQGVR